MSRQDLCVQDRVIRVTSGSADGDAGDAGGSSVKEKLLVDFFKENTDRWYPGIGHQTFRVPPIHINKGKVGLFEKKMKK